MRFVTSACAAGLMFTSVAGWLAPQESQHNWFEDFSPDYLSEAPAGGPAKYSYQSFAQSTVVSRDGMPRTERFAASEVGDRTQHLREARQAYATSESPMMKMSFERFMDARAVKVSVERNRTSGEAHSHEKVRGLDAAGRDTFEKEFEEKRVHLPRLTQEGAKDRASEWVQALPPTQEKQEALADHPEPASEVKK